jgi:hypothetical protein
MTIVKIAVALCQIVRLRLVAKVGKDGFRNLATTVKGIRG